MRSRQSLVTILLKNVTGTGSRKFFCFFFSFFLSFVNPLSKTDRLSDEVKQSHLFPSQSFEGFTYMFVNIKILSLGGLRGLVICTGRLVFLLVDAEARHLLR